MPSSKRPSVVHMWTNSPNGHCSALKHSAPNLSTWISVFLCVIFHLVVLSIWALIVIKRLLNVRKMLCRIVAPSQIQPHYSCYHYRTPCFFLHPLIKSKITFRNFRFSQIQKLVEFFPSADAVHFVSFFGRQWKKKRKRKKNGASGKNKHATQFFHFEKR